MILSAVLIQLINTENLFAKQRPALSLPSKITIKLKVTPNGNTTNYFCWRQKSSSLSVAQCNNTISTIILHRPILYNKNHQKLYYKTVFHFLWQNVWQMLSKDNRASFQKVFKAILMFKKITKEKISKLKRILYENFNILQTK